MKNITIQKLADKSAKIGIVGLGYISLPLILHYVDIGYKVLGLDTDAEKVNELNNGETYIEHVLAEKITAASNNLFEATTDFLHADEAEAVILCMLASLNKYREPDMSFVIDTTGAVKLYLCVGQVLSLESTTYPGTTGEELLSRVEEGGSKAGENVFLVCSPERGDPGNPDFGTRAIPKVIGDHALACLKVGLALYQPAVNKVVPISSTKITELTKLPENIHRTVNIGLVNKVKIVTDKMDTDIRKVIDAAVIKPFGFIAYYPDPGLGDHCISIGPFYLTWKACEYGVNIRSIELVGGVNSPMPEYVVNKTALALNDHQRSIKGSKVLVLNIVCKRSVDDIHESPPAEVIELLRNLGAEISYSGPRMSVLPKVRKHKFDLRSVPLTAESIASYDCAVLIAGHDEFDCDLLKQHAKLIVNMHGEYSGKNNNIVEA